jgi:uncharacterized DUF497 family protein
MSQQFEWDDAKAASNAKKHGVSFIEAATVFNDPLARELYDEQHSMEEDRELLIGHSDKGRLLLVSFAARGNSIRIISARLATKRERKDHEEKDRFTERDD